MIGRAVSPMWWAARCEYAMRRRGDFPGKNASCCAIATGRSVISLAWQGRFIPFHRRGANSEQTTTARAPAPRHPLVSVGRVRWVRAAATGTGQKPPKNRGRSSRSQPPFPPAAARTPHRTARHDTTRHVVVWPIGPDPTPARTQGQPRCDRLAQKFSL